MRLSAIALAILALSGASAMACGNKSNVQASAADRTISTATVDSTKATDSQTVVK